MPLLICLAPHLPLDFLNQQYTHLFLLLARPTHYEALSRSGADLQCLRYLLLNIGESKYFTRHPISGTWAICTLVSVYSLCCSLHPGVSCTLLCSLQISPGSKLLTVEFSNAEWRTSRHWFDLMDVIFCISWRYSLWQTAVMSYDGCGFSHFPLNALLMENFYWSRHRTDLPLWRHWYCICYCYLILYCIAVAPLSNKHNINDVIMESINHLPGYTMGNIQYGRHTKGEIGSINPRKGSDWISQSKGGNSWIIQTKGKEMTDSVRPRGGNYWIRSKKGNDNQTNGRKWQNQSDIQTKGRKP